MRTVAAPAPSIVAGAHIRIVSPCFPTLAHIPERGHRAEKALRGRDFEVSYGEHAFGMSADGITAGSPEDRAADLMTAFADPAVDALLISDAGLGSADLPGLLDPAVITANPKPLIGVCDTIYLHQYLASLGVGSYYGCSLIFHLGDVGGPFPEMLDCLASALSGAAPLRCLPLGDKAAPPASWHDAEVEGAPRVRDYSGAWTWLRDGSGSGPLFGGEISLLPKVARRFDFDYSSTVLFWDVSEEQPAPVEDLVANLAAAVDLTRLAGMVVGSNPRVRPADWVSSVSAALERAVPAPTYPIVINADICHMTPSWVLPFGEDAVLDSRYGLTFPRTTGSS